MFTAERADFCRFGLLAGQRWCREAIFKAESVVRRRDVRLFASVSWRLCVEIRSHTCSASRRLARLAQPRVIYRQRRRHAGGVTYDLARKIALDAKDAQLTAVGRGAFPLHRNIGLAPIL